MNKVDSLQKLLASSYALYLKAQNYHWNIEGANFYSYHQLFEDIYSELAIAIDEIAERIRVYDVKAIASFTEFEKNTSIKGGDNSLNEYEMLNDLFKDQELILKDIDRAIKYAKKDNDEACIELLAKRQARHEKIHWMLASSLKLSLKAYSDMAIAFDDINQMIKLLHQKEKHK